MRYTKVSCYQDVPIIEDFAGNVYTHADPGVGSVLEAIDSELSQHGLELLSGDFGSSDYFFCIKRRENNMGEDEFTSLLGKFTDDELEEELERRNKPPKQLEEPDFTNLKQEADNYLIGVRDQRIPKDGEHYLFETLMKTLYGPDIFHWINPRM
jgi:hypothetical protein